MVIYFMEFIIDNVQDVSVFKTLSKISELLALLQLIN